MEERVRSQSSITMRCGVTLWGFGLALGILTLWKSGFFIVNVWLVNDVLMCTDVYTSFVLIHWEKKQQRIENCTMRF